MRMIHPEDLAHRLRPEYRGYLMKFLDQIGGVIVYPDPVTIPNDAMPGTFASPHGQFGQDEPFPPYEPERAVMEEAKAQARQSD
jgi:hypothetical protein